MVTRPFLKTVSRELGTRGSAASWPLRFLVRSAGWPHPIQCAPCCGRVRYRAGRCSLVAQSRGLGLSLGDRAYLALGIALHAPVYTADRAWKGLKLDVPIHVIR